LTPPADPALSHFLIVNAFAFIMVLCRAGAAIALLPGLGEDVFPASVRVGVAVTLALVIMPIVQPALPPPPADFGHLALLIMGEIAAGLFLGWLARLPALALPAAMQIISITTGLTSLFNPDTNFGAQTSILGRLFGVAGPTLILSTGLYALPLQALLGSYAALPPGHLPPLDDVTHAAVRAVTAHFALAVQLATPFLLLATIWHAGLGLIARLVPHLQVYFTALPGQILGGLFVLALIGGALTQTWLSSTAHRFATLPGG